MDLGGAHRQEPTEPEQEGGASVVGVVAEVAAEVAAEALVWRVLERAGAVCDARAQHFLQTTNAITAMRMVAPNIAAGKENRQWSAENGFWTVSSHLSNLLASKLPLMCFLRSVIIAVSCSLSLWLKSCDRDIVQLSQEWMISMSSDSSAEMRWSIVGM